MRRHAGMEGWGPKMVAEYDMTAASGQENVRQKVASENAAS